MPRLIERERSFPRDAPIDCRHWDSFVIVGETYRYHRIRFTRFDNEPHKSVQSNLTREQDPHHDDAR